MAKRKRPNADIASGAPSAANLDTAINGQPGLKRARVHLPFQPFYLKFKQTTLTYSRASGYPGRFKGTVSIEGSRKDSKAPLEAAISAEKHVSSDGDIQINIFVDGSAESPSNENELKTDIHGGYAVVFRRMAPGDSQDDMMVQRGWHVFPAVDIQFCEGLAITEAIKLANRDLRIAIHREGIRAITRGKRKSVLLTHCSPIKVKIYSDSQEVLKLFEKETFGNADQPPLQLQQDSATSEQDLSMPAQPPSILAQSSSMSTQLSSMSAQPSSRPAPSSTKSTQDSPMSVQDVPMSAHDSSMLAQVLAIKEEKIRLMQDVIERGIKASEELQNLPDGSKVDLELYWLPSHLHTGMKVLMHEQADHLAKECRLECRDIFLIGDETFRPQAGVIASLKSPLLVPPRNGLPFNLGPEDRPSPVVGGVPPLVGRDGEFEEGRQVQSLVERQNDIEQRERKFLVLCEKAQADLKRDKKAVAEEKNKLAVKEDANIAWEEAVFDREEAVVDREENMRNQQDDFATQMKDLTAREETIWAREAMFQIQMEAQDKEMRSEMRSRERQVERQVAALLAHNEELMTRQRDIQARAQETQIHHRQEVQRLMLEFANFGLIFTENPLFPIAWGLWLFVSGVWTN
ncbi:hypothetical protein QBC39DRAFT_397889 [Podospora conica]|nr:hypothetical protein QBC39DRAFT_397889 [Schizothecium conicum]